MAVYGRRQPLLSNPLECPSWVNFGLSRPTAATSAFGGEADIGGPLFRAGHIRLRFLLPSGEDLTFGRRRPGRHTLVSGVLGPSQRSAGRFPAAAQARARESASKQLGICARGAQLEGMECSRRTAAVVRGKEKRPSLVLQFAPRPRCRQLAHKYRTQDLRKEAPATHTHVAWPEPDCTYYCTGGVCRIPAAHSIATRTTMAAKAPPVQYAVFLVSGVMVESST